MYNKKEKNKKRGEKMLKTLEAVHIYIYIYRKI